MRTMAVTLLCQGILATTGAVLAGDRAAEEVAQVLDDFHTAASDADGERYFGHLAPDAVYLGTDAGERWSADEFREYARPHFSAGRGWTYVAVQRHVRVSAGGDLAWFDEKLNNEKYGEVRGTGVLRKGDGVWKIVHYSLTFLVPNAAAADVVKRIRREPAPDRQ